jgi:1-deoxy-D-xylulose-5-phosphate synthase
MLHDAVTLVESGPVAIRYPRGAARQVTEAEVGSGLSARKARSGTATCIVAIGKMLETAEKAADVLAADGIDVTVWDARCCAPLDTEMIADASTHARLLTIEDGIRDGGIGMAIGDAVCSLRTATEVTMLGLPTKFIPHDPKSTAILSRFGLDVDSLVALVRGA